MATLIRDKQAPGLREKMEALAHFVMRMEPAEISVFLDALFPSMRDEEKEDLYDLIVFEQRKEDAGGRPAGEVFAEIERKKTRTR